MATHLALLRGINVGGRNKVPMAELREVVTSLGYTGVTSYIQSGNVLFTAPDSDTAKLASALEAAITNPVSDGIPVSELPPELLDRVKTAESAAAAKGSRDAVAALGPALYLHTPDGFGTSELAQAVLRILVPSGKHHIAATARNWSTATKLLSLCEET